MNVDRKELVHALEIVYPAVGTNALLPVFQNVKVDGAIVEGTDGAIKIETTLPVDLGLHFCVNASGFLSLLRSLKYDQIDLELKDNILQVKTDKMEGEFKLTSNAKFPRIEFSDNIVSEIDLAGLHDGLAMCKLGVSQDETAGVLCGVIFTPTDAKGETYLYATDRFRILRAKWTNPYKEQFSLPIKFIDILMKGLFSKIIFMDYTGDRFQVQLKDGTNLSTLVHDGNFMDLAAFYPTKDMKYLDVGFESDFKDIFARHTVFLKEMDMVDKEVSITAKDHVCVLKSHANKLGVLEEETYVSTPEALSFSLNPVLVQDILSKADSFKFYDAEGIVLFTSGDLEYLIQTRE